MNKKISRSIVVFILILSLSLILLLASCSILKNIIKAAAGSTSAEGSSGENSSSTQIADIPASSAGSSESGNGNN